MALTDWVFPEMGYTREQDKRALYEKRLPVINIHQKDSADKLYNMILDKLSNDVKIMI